MWNRNARYKILNQCQSLMEICSKRFSRKQRILSTLYTNTVSTLYTNTNTQV